MNRKEAEDFVYQSYVKAEKNQDYQAKDAKKRHPELSRKVIQSKSGTPAVTITGSKGKGSVANMISQILQTQHKVGLMTSPHILDFCERFKINGKDIPGDTFARYMTAIAPEIRQIDENLPDDVCISPMGIQADFALAYFNGEHTTFNVLEGGKGVKYDDVNNVVHSYGVINSIFLEHTRELGETLEAIAEDKSHIITGEQKCVYSAEQTPEVRAVLERRASVMKVPLKMYGRDFHAENISYRADGMAFDVVIGTERYENLVVPLFGEHQARNCALALAFCLDVLENADIKKIRETLLRLHWPGRMQVLQTKPFVMLDACINGASCIHVKQVLKHLNLERVTLIVGIPDDKDYAGVVRNMQEAAEVTILTRSQNAHYVFTQKQQDLLSGEGIDTIRTNSVEEAIAFAEKDNRPIVILGTTSVVGEVSNIFRSRSTGI